MKTYPDSCEIWNCFLFPNWGLLPYNYSKPDPEKEGLRAKLLSFLTFSSVEDPSSSFHRKKACIVTYIDAMVLKTPLPTIYKDCHFYLKRNLKSESDPLRNLIEYLEQNHYQRVPIVEKQGQYSLKGGLIDIFCPGYFNPIRIDFFDDIPESIRFFDPLSQSSLEDIEEIFLSPVRDIPLESAIIEKIRSSKEYKAHLSQGSRDTPPFLGEDGHTEGFWDVYPLGMPTGSLLDYLDEKTNLLFWDKKSTLNRLDAFFEEQRIFFDKADRKFVLQPEELYHIGETLEASFSQIDDMVEISSLRESQEEFSLEIHETKEFKGKISEWIDHIKSLTQESFDKEGKKSEDKKPSDVYIVSSTDAQTDRLEHILASYQIDLQDLHFLRLPLKSGFSWEDGVVFTEKEIFGKQIKTRFISKSKTQSIESFVELKQDDYIVHLNYGIGRFLGLKRMEIRGHQRDFLELIYAQGDKIFVPLEQLNSIHRYIGSTENPVLDHIGKKSGWQRTKEKVRETIEKLAEELLELYAKREKSRGVVFSPDSEFQEEFEAAFEYDETQDQISAINDIKKDMESIHPMDRLICGDVGYGKTEIAIRAIFKAVMAGKQAALLCPTTILAFQHYQTFSRRFQKYPISVEFISRFKSPSQIKAVKEQLREGKIDVIIGTHALLAKDVSFRSLGLLIIDEEQKFGVIHKETIRKLKANIDTITMTATPIPRTLQMSLVGIRDLSLIETPPRDRKKIETYVLSENEEILRQAILAELKREGQVFILHNRIKTIATQAKKIRNLLPQQRLTVLHGQMSEDVIEDLMIDFYEHKYDILLCTTIIESGIDIPNVNTLIVLDSHKFGLSQLYQLKGRVGRSDRQAYAYFFYPPHPHLSLTETASRRLNTLQEYNELGDGFKVAMKDLEIRGAGSILGKEQSGDIMAVGFELYVRMLKEKIHQSEMVIEEWETNVSIPQNYYIPDSYINDLNQKMEFYKKLAWASSEEELGEVRDQLIDRFGRMPEQMLCILYTEEVRILAHKLRLDRLIWDDETFWLTANHKTEINLSSLALLAGENPSVKLSPDRPKEIAYSPKEKSLYIALSELKDVLKLL